MFNGILPMYKPKGMTSHDLVFKARKILKMKKIGHTGTLDPDVDGVLVLCLGQATKLVDYFMEGKKEYRGSICLGYATETEDASGNIIQRTPVLSPVSVDLIDQAMEKFQGNITQIPPYYSAVKVKGRRLYDYARKGEMVERPRRQVTIYNFERTSQPLFDSEHLNQVWDFKVVCSKGTYVRTLAVDLGRALGYASHMNDLQRTQSAGFDLQACNRLEDLSKLSPDEVANVIVPLSFLRDRIPSIDLRDDQVFKVEHGQVVDKNYFDEEVNQATALFYQENLLAIYKPHPEKPGKLKPHKMFPRL